MTPNQSPILNAIRAVAVALALVLAATACSADATVGTAEGVDAADAAGVTAEGSGETAAESSGADEQAQTGSAVAGQAVLPNAICRNGAMIDGLIDAAWLESEGLAEASAIVAGDEFVVDEWKAYPDQSCVLVSLKSGATLTVTAAHTNTVDGEVVSTATVGGRPVDYLASADGLTNFAQVFFDDPGNPNGMSTMVWVHSGNAESGAEAQAVLQTIIERAAPNLVFDSPTVEVAAEAAPTAVPGPDLSDPYQAWKAEMIPQWVADCEAGDLHSCDFLWYVSGRDTPELEVGMSCGGTREATPNSRCVLSIDAGAAETEGDHPLLDQFTGECRAGDELSCRKLYALVSGASAYFDYADDCLSEIRESPGPCSVTMFESGNDS